MFLGFCVFEFWIIVYFMIHIHDYCFILLLFYAMLLLLLLFSVIRSFVFSSFLNLYSLCVKFPFVSLFLLTPSDVYAFVLYRFLLLSVLSCLTRVLLSLYKVCVFWNLYFTVIHVFLWCIVLVSLMSYCLGYFHLCLIPLLFPIPNSSCVLSCFCLIDSCDLCFAPLSFFVGFFAPHLYSQYLFVSWLFGFITFGFNFCPGFAISLNKTHFVFCLHPLICIWVHL